MATLNHNRQYLAFDGVDFSAYYTDRIQYTRHVTLHDITSGANITHETLAAGIEHTRIVFAVVYDTADIDLYKQVLQPGHTGMLIYGPDGNAAGKPKHEQWCILERIDGPSPTIEQDHVMLVLTFRGAAAPVSTITGSSAGVFGGE